MPRFRILTAALLLAGFLSSRAEAANTIVKLDTAYGSTTLELFDDAKPVTVANFLKYIRSGRYVQSFAHRLASGFVLQGGGYWTVAGSEVLTVNSYGAIVNEPGPFPQYSNVAGTIAMAKLGGDPNSATSQWFINLADNNTGPNSLDVQNSGFTVFGKIISGMEAIQAYATFTTYNENAGSGTNVIVNAGSPFDTIPVRSMLGSSVRLSDLVYTTWTVPGDPIPSITSATLVNGEPGQPFEYQITATNSPTSFAVVDNTLPTGLVLDTTTGLISGTPTAATKQIVSVTATNAEGTGGSPLAISIATPTPSPTPTPPVITSAAPPPTITTKSKVTGTSSKLVLKGSTSTGTTLVEIKAGKGNFKKVKGSSSKWTFTIKGLKPGKYKFQVRATNTDGQTTISVVKVTVR